MRGVRSADEELHVLACAACPRVSSATARGWLAYVIDDPYGEQPPALAFYCPACARSSGDVDGLAD